MKLKFSQQTLKKFSNIKFYENPSTGKQVAPHGWMGIHIDMMKPTAAFCNFGTHIKTSFTRHI
jgi:hypothetical protein